MSTRTLTLRLAVQDDASASLDRYQDKMASVNRETRQAGNASSRAQGQFDAVGGAIKGAIAAISISEVVSLAGEMQALGAEVNATRTIFEQLTGGADNAEAALNRLRAATGNVVTDNDLRTGGNLLMRMGLAETPEEMEQLIGLIARLKKPTEDMSSAIENFNLMLANQSIERLDSFGLSSGRVRMRINELLESGQALNREEAFKMAVLEQGEVALLRLGDAANVSMTSMNRLQASLGNLAQEASANFATGVEASAGLLELALGVHPAQIEESERRARIAAEDMAAIFAQEFDRGDLSDDFVTNYMQTALDLARENPTLAQDIDAFASTVASRMDGALYNAPRGSFDPLALTSGSLDSYLESMSQIAITEAQIGDERRANLELAEQQAIAAEDAAFAEELRREQIELSSRAMGNMERIDALEIEAIAVAFENVDAAAGTLSTLEMPEFMTQDQADRMRALADEAERVADEMAEMADANPDIFSDAQLTNARETAEKMGTMADDAQKAADALRDITLSEIFGQSDGGVTGEIADAVIAAAAAQGLSEEQIGALTRELDLSSGRETAGSLNLQENIAPLIARASEELGPEVASAMVANVRDALLEAALAGVDTNTEEFQASLNELLTGPLPEDFDASEFVQPFLDVEEPVANIAEDMGTVAEDMTTASESLTTAGEEVGALNEALPATVEAATGLAAQFGTMEAAVVSVRRELAIISQTEYRVRFKIEASDPDGVLGFLRGGGLDGAIERAVQNNGGRTPGADARTM